MMIFLSFCRDYILFFTHTFHCYLLQWHPDKNPDNEEAKTNFQKISEAYATLSDDKKRKIYDQYGAEGVTQSEQMGDDHPMGGGMGGGMPFGFRPQGHGGGGHQHHMSPEDAEMFFSQFFGGGGDPFGGSVGGGGQRGGPRGRVGGGSPFGSMGGHPGMGARGHPGFGARQPQEKRYYGAIPAGTVVSLKGLVSKPERNGDRGEVQQYDPRSDRYVVVLEDTNEAMSVKPSNLLQHVHVKLHDLESRPDLNGQRGTILAWNASTERYNVYVIPLSKVIGMRSSNIVLDNDTVAQITGLVSKPELNGKWGTIKKWNQDSGRYDVQISAAQILRLKPENMQV